MNHNKFPPLPVRILVIVIVLSTIGYFAYQTIQPEEDGQLAASGTIESVTVNVSPEMAGKVTEVLASEGQFVGTGDPLLRLDDSLLQSEKRSAQSALDSANAAVRTAEVALEAAQLQYDLTLSNALVQESNTRTAIWDESKPSQFDQPVWYFSKEERIQAAQAEVDMKKAALDDAIKRLAEISERAGSSDFLEIEANLVQMRLAFENAQAVFDATSGTSDNQTLRDAAQITLDEAEIDLEDAQKDYDDALTTEGAEDVLEARADAIIAREAHDLAVDNLRALETGVYAPQVQAAAKVVEQAQATLDQAKANVASAKARLAVIDTQLKKVAVFAPMDGVVLARNVEVGEFVQPGAGAFTLANLDELTITVYVPEDQYGNISLGQEASVTVDSFPNETFDAVVVQIADQAEFTPRNVQTVEGRSSTVYAIKLMVTDSESKLKIGMPADVVFK
ncbi:MAG TPA: efflux RND transporter periplasmic adaptor subunit [Anaerolineales bacterium]|nr:efflux RND transporter periplasmic adaptor subunit [Anaerolineales bacterium]